MTTSVIIATLNRPDYVRRCLACLRRQTQPADQVIVVDASPDDLTRKVVEEFAEALYLRNDLGGWMTASRNIGLAHSTGEILAFLDDDSFAHPQWLENLVAAYDADDIGGVGGRALNGQPDEETRGVEQIGKILSCGEVTGNFAADPGRIIETDHMIGCNMSFRRSIVEELGGFREDYLGISGVREETDASIRVKQLGYRIVFQPAACVDHVAAPQARGKRFDSAYAYYATRNQFVLLVRNFGLGSAIVRRYTIYSTLHFVLRPFAAQVVKAVGLLFATGFGTLAGLAAGARLAGRDPRRHDQKAQALRQAMRGLSHDAPANEPAASGSQMPLTERGQAPALTCEKGSAP